MTSMPELCRDLGEEQSSLDDLVASLSDDQWTLATPSEGWSIADQISHLAFYDHAAVIALTDPDHFATVRAEIIDAALNGRDESIEPGRTVAPHELLTWWRTGRHELVERAATADSAARVDWIGPSMSAASFVSARLMETWAHGTDVADALGVVRPPTDRLAHVAHLCVRARAWSYAVHDLAMPPGEVRVELVAPSGAVWAWGPDDAADVVRGRADDFCLVCTQRRHRSDVGLELTGPLAQEWMAIAQAFAGPAGAGRAPRG